MLFICWTRVDCGTKGASAIAITLDDESVPSAVGPCADAMPQVRINTKLKWKERFMIGNLALYGETCLKQLELRQRTGVAEVR